MDRKAVLGSLLFAFLLGGIAMAQEPRVVVYQNARIVTNVATQPRAEAVAVAGGRILWVGSREAIPDSLAAGAAHRDLGGMVLLPGLADAHLHVEGLGLAQEEIDLVGTRSFEEVLQRVAEAASRTPKGEWILGRGWDQNDWPEKRMPTHERLSAITPDHPVFLRRVDGHAALVNLRAMRIAGLDRTTPDPEGGQILRDAQGDPTGVLVDAATEIVRRHIPRPSRSIRRRRIEKGLRACLEAGLTMVHVAGADGVATDIFQELRAQGRLPIRVYLMLDGSDEELLRTWLARGPLLDPEDRLIIRAVKLYADGALGSRGAALLAPYADRPETRGLLVMEPVRLAGLMRRVHAAGFQCCVHAIGDRANRIVLDILEEILQARPRPDARHRIEHAQILSPQDIPRFAELGVVASMQFTHATSDMPWARDRLGPERLEGAYAWRSLLETGAVLAEGSDAPVESPNAFLGLYAGITRQDTTGAPPGVWLPEQRLTPREALEAATVGAARAAFLEDRLGRIAPGYWADFTLTDTDPLEDPPERLLRARVLGVCVAGRWELVSAEFAGLREARPE
jgi:hypothetical protein